MVRSWNFLRHWFTAKTRHGVHSPFVYGLVEDCFYPPFEAIDRDAKAHFERLKSSNEVVEGVDHGNAAGEVTYRIGTMAKRAAARDFESELLARLACYHELESLLELGTNLGKTAAFVAGAAPDCTVSGVEGNAGLAAFANTCFSDLELSNARCMHQTFERFFDTNQQRFDAVFIDGDHHYDPTLKNYEQAKNVLKGEGPIVLHDIYWSTGMTKAWEKIKADDAATVTIDLFFFGLVYIRPGQEKEHFRIRYPRSVLQLIRA